MSNNDSGIVSSEHYEFLQLSQVGRLSERVSKVVDAEEQSLRQFNAELLQKIGEYRKKNLELSTIENDLRSQLAIQLKKASERERELTAKTQSEIDTLTSKLQDVGRSTDESNEDWSRRLAKLSDENWALGLENENLKRSESDLQHKLDLSQQEIQKSRELEESARSRETQMAAAYEALRVEYANIDQCYSESNAALVKLQSEMRERSREHETELQELTTYLTAKAAQESVMIRDENARFRESLSFRDTRLDQDKTALQTWKEQLSYLDQHLKQFSEKLKKSKSELVRLVKSVEDEVQFSVANPFTDYLEMADLEVSQITHQLSGVSSMSPLKGKLEARLHQANAHRDALNAILEKSNVQLKAHSESLHMIVKGLEFLN
jgi:chromosome segregation ATPase